MNKVIKASGYDLPEELEIQSLPSNESVRNEQSQSVLDEAFQKAKQIVESAQSYSEAQKRDCSEQITQELEEARKRGYQEGFSRGREEGEKSGVQAGTRQGFSEGTQKAEAESRKSLNELAQMLQTVEKSKSEILSKFETDLKDLALTIARTILKRELKIDPQTLQTIIQSAVDSYRNQAWVRIYVSGNTADLLTKADLSLARALESVSDNVKVVVSTELSDESCVIEMPDQVIDAGMDTQLQKIQTVLKESEQSVPS